MRITEKNTPILKYLKWNRNIIEHPDFGDVKTQGIFAVNISDQIRIGRDNIERILNPFVENWPYCQRLFSKTIDVVSIPFIEAAYSNYSKLATPETLQTLYKKEISGTLILGDTTLCYYYHWREDNNIEYTALVHQRGLVVYACTENGEFEAEVAEDKKQTIEAGGGLGRILRILPIIIYLFKKYATVDIIPAIPFKKVKLPENDTILVDSTLKINYIDCSWFRTIIKKEGFMVKGHFRLQPYKNDKKEWDYKLIYIEPFQKHGYTRTAKKIVDERKE